MKEEQPIIIRRPRVVAGGHYGGAWKIALADFMTALMALFLVLWVISMATPEQLVGLAEYFNTPLSQAIAGGDRVAVSPNIIPGGGPDASFTEGGKPTPYPDTISRQGNQRWRLRELSAQIESVIEADENLSQFKDQIRLEMTPDGLRVRVVDTERRPMFALGSDRLEPGMSRLLREIGPLLNELPNELSLSGHTDSNRYYHGDKGYSNWELAADRANASRRALVAGGLDPDRLLRVSGFADRLPLAGSDQDDAVNRRIELLVLTDEAAQRIRGDVLATGAPAVMPDGHERPAAGGVGGE